MKSKVLVLAMLVAAFSSAPAMAYWHGQAKQTDATPEKKKGPHPKKWDITLSILFGTNGTSGPCTGGSGTADYCPSGDCTCYTATGSVKGTAGNGTVTLYETYDDGSTFTPITGDSSCSSAYVDIEINGTKDAESVYMAGGDCGSVIMQGFLNGGCELTDSSGLFSEVGSGFCGGSYSDEGPAKFTIKGNGE
jgi:hypothetical protein